MYQCDYTVFFFFFVFCCFFFSVFFFFFFLAIGFLIRNTLYYIHVM